jgi:hypothetical protein
MLPALIPWLRATHLINIPFCRVAAASSAKKRKHKKYSGIANLYKFVPFAVKTLVPFGEEPLDLVKDLGSRRLIES